MTIFDLSETLIIICSLWTFYRLTPVSKPVNKRLVKLLFFFLLLPLSPIIHNISKPAWPTPPPWPPPPPTSPKTPRPPPASLQLHPNKPYHPASCQSPTLKSATPKNVTPCQSFTIKWVTLINVALSWAKFLLVKHARPRPPPTSPQPPWPPTPSHSPQNPKTPKPRDDKFLIVWNKSIWVIGF